MLTYDEDPVEVCDVGEPVSHCDDGGVGQLLQQHPKPKTMFKGTVSQELRPMLLYTIQKLFSRRIVAHIKFSFY